VHLHRSKTSFVFFWKVQVGFMNSSEKSYHSESLLQLKVRVGVR